MKTPTPAELRAANEIVGVLNDSEYGEHFHFEDREEIRKIIAPIISTELHLDEVRDTLKDIALEGCELPGDECCDETTLNPLRWCTACKAQRALDFLTK